VFALALELGIDDPISWFNAVGDRVVDAWIGYKKHELARSSKNSSEQLDPAEAHERLINGSFNRHLADGHHRSNR
jgi:hypothetical protein